MIVELALATNTHPGPWFDEDEATIATAVDILKRRAEQMEQARRAPKRKGR